MKGRILILLAGMAAGAGCNESDDAFLALSGVAVPNATCQFDPDPDTFQSGSSYDPRNGSAFAFTPVVENRLAPTVDNNQEFFEDDSLFIEGNTVRVLGFDVCYIRADDARLEGFGSVDNDGFPVDCETDSLPGEFVAAQVAIPPSGQIVVPSSVLSDPVLRTLFGDQFAPDRIPPIGEFDNDRRFSNQPVPASADPRDENWGDFPSTGASTVFVIATAVGQRNNGGVVRSDPFQFPVSVIPGGFDDFCDAPFIITCLDGERGFRGQAPDFETTCQLSSGIGIQCADFNTCPEANGG